MSTTRNTAPKITSTTLRARKGDPQAAKIVAITAYDYTFARLFDETADVMLVGDSLGMTIQGEPNTLAVTVDHMIYHARAVAAGTRRAHLVVDLPFGSYQASARDAMRAAARLLGEGRAEAVKMEGGIPIRRTVEKLVSAGVPVMGHVGLTPQHVHQFGGFKVQGKTEAARQSILADALAIEEAGAYAVVLEGIPADLARAITERLRIPTIGIGAGRDCDGQVLVMQDLLGLNVDFQPRFVKRFAALGEVVSQAVRDYADEIQSGKFPGEENSF